MKCIRRPRTDHRRDTEIAEAKLRKSWWLSVLCFFESLWQSVVKKAGLRRDNNRPAFPGFTNYVRLNLLSLIYGDIIVIPCLGHDRTIVTGSLQHVNHIIITNLANIDSVSA